MKFIRYCNLDCFRDVVLDLLLTDEICNNLPISILADKTPKNTIDWLMGTIISDDGKVLLIILRTPPFNMLLYTANYESSIVTESSAIEEALLFLAEELRNMSYKLPGINAETKYAKIFTDAYTQGIGTADIRSMLIMRLDKLQLYSKAPGACRVLIEEDLSFVPLWEQAFCRDCRLPVTSLEDKTVQIRTRLGRNLHYIWEDGVPVSQAVFGRETPNGAVITWVYTPPEYRGRGYATSVVGELSGSLLGHRKKFCCLYADADNPVSCGIYRKLGYYEVCAFDEINYET